MIHKADIITAINKGYEAIATLQFEIAKRSRVSGDVTMFNKHHLTSVKLYAYMDALDNVAFNHNIPDNKTVEVLYNKIKIITKDLRQWN